MKTRNIIIVAGIAALGYYLFKTLKPTSNAAPIAPPPPPQKRVVRKDNILNTPVTTKYPIGQTPVEETKILYPDAFKGSVINVTTPDGKITSSGTSGLIDYMNRYQSSTYGKLDPRTPNYR